MKTAIILAALALTTGIKAEAQSVRMYDAALYGNNKQTVLNGQWEMRSNKNGSLTILDKDKNVVRTAVANSLSIAANNGTPTYVNYPFTLALDACGDLHIIDTAPADKGMAAYTATTPASSFLDPDAVQVSADPVAVNVKGK